MSLHDLELKISKLLRVGVLVAGAFIFVGWITSLATQGDHLFLFKEYHSTPLLDTVRADLASHNWGDLITYFGLAVLVMLPVSRVLLTGILFFVQKDKVLGWIALAVFVVLVASFSLGIDL